MKQTYLRVPLFVAMTLSCLFSLSAQIILHEATDITQTKATLSADFPDLNSEHGFQYKLGNLPEIDDFSRTALADVSDPIKIISSGPNAWSARTAKGWVESNPNVPIGQSSIMSTTIEIYEDNAILTFEWKVDSEENLGFLTFSIDGIVQSKITGLTDFAKVSQIIGKGKHVIEWIYSKSSNTNIGLDLGIVRNISIQNTTPNKWINVECIEDVANLSNLIPNLSYLYRAYQGVNKSAISTFCTKEVYINRIFADHISQTKASINMDIDSGDAEYTYKLASCNYTPELEALLSPESDIPVIDNPDNWYADNGQLVGKTSWSSDLILKFTLLEPAEISFNCYIDGGYIRSSISGATYHKSSLTVLGKTYEPTATSRPTNHLEPATFTNQTFLLPAGYHEVIFHLNHNGSAGSNSTAKVWNLKINGIKPEENYNFKSLPMCLDNLLPDHTYKVRGIIHYSSFDKEDKNNWSRFSDVLTFKTLPLIVSADTCNITQSSVSITGVITRGDAETNSIGIQFREKKGSWSTIDLDNSLSNFTHVINRLRPGKNYEFRAFAIPNNCDTVYSEILQFNTKSVEAIKPTVVKLSQHEVTLQGHVIFGNATIYQRGMQFRKKGLDTWEEVEDGGNDSIFTLVKKNLEMGATYQARTYVQPAGCDIIYSDMLEFTTLESYFVKANSDETTQTTITLVATLADVDEGVSIERYGFEYYIDSDGFFENAQSFVKSEVFDIPVIPNGKELKTTITGLCPSLGIRWRAYAQINGIKTYFTSYKNWEWDRAGTKRAKIAVSIKNITQSSISLELDATQDEGDAVISQIEYALANSINETNEYAKCGNTLTIHNLLPNRQYNLRFRGNVNGRLCPLLKDVSSDYSWFEYKTLPMDVNVQFSNITQTTAKMKVEISAGDIPVSNLRYSIDNGEIAKYYENMLLKNLAPGKTYYVIIYADVNGKELPFTMNLADEYFKFTTKSVTSSSSLSDIFQTSAKINWNSIIGDATFISSGIEINGKTYQSDKVSDTKICNELLPNKAYSFRSFVETKEGGRAYSSTHSFTTKDIECETLPVANISNRSATLNGTIECDSYSSAEFGFQWKQMVGWISDPAFTKGRKLDDGTISVALVNGMLEPNTDYQYRAAVRYQDHIYYASNWVTFRTESEFVYYPASVYTLFRTDRENNSLVLCGYYVPGSETIVSQGYEYWMTGGNAPFSRAPQSVSIINTDESMHHTFNVGEIPAGNYSIRAFVKTESGNTIYGTTLSFASTSTGYSGVGTIDSELPEIIYGNGVVKIYNANNLNCIIYTLNGQIIVNKTIDSSYSEFSLMHNNFYIVSLSNGLTKKIKL